MAGLQGLVPDPLRRSYVAKFGLVIVLVLLVTLGVAGFYYVDISEEITADVQSEMELTAELEADEIGSWIETQEQQAAALASDGDADLAGSSDIGINTALKNELTFMPDEVQRLHYVDLESNEIAHSTDEAVVGTDLAELGVDVHEREVGYVEEHEFDGSYIADGRATHSDVYESNGEPVMAFFGPIEGEDAAVMIVVSVDGVSETFAESIEGSTTEVVDASDGNVMLANESDAVLSTYRDGPDSRVIEEGRSGPGSTEFDDADDVVAYAPVPNTDWVIATHAPQTNAYALVDDVAGSLIVIISIALAGFLIIGATIGRSTANALEGLAEDATRLSEGDTSITIEDDGRIDEVGQVRTAFAGIQSYLETAADQADAIARQEFDDPALERDVPGGLGDSLETMRADLESYIDDLEASKAEAEASQEQAAEARREAEELAQRLERKAGEFADVMADAADGDFTRRLDENVDNDALAEIAAAFNGMLEDLERTVLDIQGMAEEVDRVSRDVTARVEEIEQASTEVSTSADEIATATAEQSQRFQEVYGEMNDLSATVEEIASTADDVASVSEEAADRAEAAGEASSEIRSEMDRLEDRTAAITDRIEQLDDEMGEIREIVDLIDDIAGQTNLLALNASIEAAAAGSEGDGFAVVADEVKSLAEETAKATQEVDDRISEVERAVEETVDEIERMQERVENGSEVVGEGIEAIEAITEQVAEANAGVQSIDEATDEQARASERVVTMVDEVTDVSEETKDETENVAAAVEEQTATIAEVASGAQTQTELAEELRDSLEAFDVDGKEADGEDVAGRLEGVADGEADTDGPTRTDADDSDGELLTYEEETDLEVRDGSADEE
ncbi:methyl-accepting chemotaxis protein [Halobiforma lacisalsi AJ5]|uniref:Methyl-accepting chemotaxis protein n=1 Tax=Natronobacterium lacisalsi AJ5 TaxID=358396 RepID=M0LJI9_NATLA|nr:methyl-accepting chemotaxis protein [Halobiforma lacisalsi]APW96550.1 methyl-accepting chemotaxis protein [Halobiforma lacisalsi AJ5]EMA32170.1 methyl-accepting chemotaxis sensory transducer [Halobiforma lacisalsi AJ5]